MKTKTILPPKMAFEAAIHLFIGIVGIYLSIFHWPEWMPKRIDWFPLYWLTIVCQAWTIAHGIERSIATVLHLYFPLKDGSHEA